LSREINRIDTWTSTLADNGLFDKQKKAFEKKDKNPDDVFEDIQINLQDARRKLRNDDLSGSEHSTSKALRSYDQALYTPSRLWRFSNVYAGPMWIYLIGFLVAVLTFYLIYQLDVGILGLRNLEPPGVAIEAAALHAATWGTVGAILRGIWFLKDKVADRRYRNSFRMYILSAPFLGGLFGAILYFILIAGLVVIVPDRAGEILSGQTTTQPAPTTTPQTNATTTPQTNATTTPQTESTTQANDNPSIRGAAIIPFAALAGFNWEWAIMIFKRIGDTFKTEPEPDDKIDR
jgi:hypothetical protein